jgi:peptidyl-prolyl cis-trans isomerase C/peptidyl-prolyl cis-trans isomerase D
MKIIHFLILSAALCLSSVSFAETAFSVGSKKVSVEEFQQRLNQVQKSSVNPPSKDQFLKDWIHFEMGVKEAYAQNLQKSPAVIQAMEQVLYNALLEKEVGRKMQNLQVKEAEMKSYYRGNPDVHTAHILVAVKADADAQTVAAAKKRALEIYQEARSGKKSFADYVKLYSDDLPSKTNGGDIGFQSRVTLVPEYYEAAKKLRTGQVSAPVQTRYGFHVIKLIGTRSYADADKSQIRAAVLDSKRNQLFEAYFKSIQGKYPVSINKAALKKID